MPCRSTSQSLQSKFLAVDERREELERVNVLLQRRSDQLSVSLQETEAERDTAVRSLRSTESRLLEEVKTARDALETADAKVKDFTKEIRRLVGLLDNESDLTQRLSQELRLTKRDLDAAREERDIFATKVGALESRLEHVTADVSERTKAVDELRNMLREAIRAREQTALEAEEMVRISVADATEQRRTALEAATRLASVEERERQAKDTIAEQEERILNYKSEIKARETREERLKEDLRATEARLTTAHADLRRVRDDVDVSATAKEMSKTAIASIRAELNASEAARLQAETALAHQIQVAQSLKQESAKLREEVDDIHLECQRVKTHSERVQRGLHTEVATLSDEAEDLRRQLAARDRQIKQLVSQQQDSSAGAEDLQARIAEVEAKLNATFRHATALEQQLMHADEDHNATVRRLRDEVAAKARELDLAHETLQRLQRTATQLHDEVAEKTSVMQKVATDRDEAREKLRRATADLQAELTQTQHLLTVESDSRARAEERVRDLADASRDLQAQLAHSHADAERRVNESRAAAVNDSRQEAAALEQSLVAERRCVAEARQSRETLLRFVDQLKQEQAHLQAKLASLDADLEAERRMRGDAERLSHSYRGLVAGIVACLHRGRSGSSGSETMLPSTPSEISQLRSQVITLLKAAVSHQQLLESCDLDAERRSLAELMAMLKEHSTRASELSRAVFRVHTHLASTAAVLRRSKAVATDAQRAQHYRVHKAALAHLERQNITVEKCAHSAAAFNRAMTEHADTIGKELGRLSESLSASVAVSSAHRAPRTLIAAVRQQQVIISRQVQTLAAHVAQQLEQLQDLTSSFAAWEANAGPAVGQGSAVSASLEVAVSAVDRIVGMQLLKQTNEVIAVFSHGDDLARQPLAALAPVAADGPQLYFDDDATTAEGDEGYDDAPPTHRHTGTRNTTPRGTQRQQQQQQQQQQQRRHHSTQNLDELDLPEDRSAVEFPIDDADDDELASDGQQQHHTSGGERDASGSGGGQNVWKRQVMKLRRENQRLYRMVRRLNIRVDEADDLAATPRHGEGDAHVPDASSFGAHLASGSAMHTMSRAALTRSPGLEPASSYPPSSREPSSSGPQRLRSPSPRRQVPTYSTSVGDSRYDTEDPPASRAAAYGSSSRPTSAGTTRRVPLVPMTSQPPPPLSTSHLGLHHASSSLHHRQPYGNTTHSSAGTSLLDSAAAAADGAVNRSAPGSRRGSPERGMPRAFSLEQLAEADEALPDEVAAVQLPQRPQSQPGSRSTSAAAADQRQRSGSAAGGRPPTAPGGGSTRRPGGSDWEPSPPNPHDHVQWVPSSRSTSRNATQ
jgi:hypothetical protein